VTWFYSYSYHYRLSFAIVPLMLLPTAAILACWLSPERLQRLRRKWRAAYLALLLVASAPGIVLALYDPNAGWDWLWMDKLQDDAARYRSGNAALMSVVEGIQAYKATNTVAPAVVAPGIVRLPFFFPLDNILVNYAPTRLDSLQGATHFIYGVPETTGAYGGIPLQQNQVVGATSLAGDHTENTPVMRRAWWHDDGIFSYDVYELHLGNRFLPPFVNNPAQADVVFGGFARFLGHDVGNMILGPQTRFIMHLYFEVLETPTQDYMIYVHLKRSGDDETLWSAWDGPVTNTADGRYYSTLLWEPGEFISDERVLELQNPDAPVGENYVLVIGMYDLLTGERVSITVDGQPAGDGYTLNERLHVVDEPGS
jgi:hypothetical protein